MNAAHVTELNLVIKKSELSKLFLESKLTSVLLYGTIIGSYRGATDDINMLVEFEQKQNEIQQLTDLTKKLEELFPMKSIGVYTLDVLKDMSTRGIWTPSLATIDVIVKEAIPFAFAKTFN